MTISELLAILNKNGIRLSISDAGESLTFTAPKGSMSADLKQEISRHKTQLLEMLRNKQPALSCISMVQKLSRDNMLPLSSAQNRLWLIDQLQGPTSAFNMPLHVFRIIGEFNESAANTAFQRLLKRQESLRVGFRSVEGSPYAVVGDISEFKIRRIDLGNMSEEVQARELEKLITQEAGFNFDLSVSPLFRVTLVRKEDNVSVLLLAMHHIITDGWSMGVLVTEWAALYNELVTGVPAQLPTLPFQYIDFSDAQNRWLASAQAEKSLSYWRERLQGAPGSIDLPTDANRGARPLFDSRVATVRVDGNLAMDLRRYAAGRQSTLFMTLFAAFNILLSRLSGQTDIVVGVPSASRHLPNVESLIGFFVNNLPIRVKLDIDGSFETVLDEVRTAVMGAFANQDVPFEKILEVVNPSRDPSRTPLFQVFFNMLSYPPQDIQLAGVELERCEGVELASKFDITLYVSDDDDDGLELKCLYNMHLFHAERMEMFMEQYVRLLHAVVADSKTCLREISLITERQVEKLPDPAAILGTAWRGAVHELVYQHAMSKPDTVALSEATNSWSYGELNRISMSIGATLQTMGVAHGDRVVIFAERKANLVASVLGVMMIGGVFCLLSSDHPTQRLVQQLEIVNPRVAIVLGENTILEREVTEYLSEKGCRMLTLESEKATLLVESQNHQAYTPAINADSPACIVFTSGSTGVPKAVLGRHGSLTHFVDFISKEFELDESSRFGMLSSLVHDPLQRDMFTPLSLGAKLVIPPESCFAPGVLSDWLRSECISVLHLTPAVGQIISSYSETELPNLSRIFLVGESLTDADVIKLFSIAPNVGVVNFYGSTESQRAVSYHRARNFDSGSGRGKGVLPLGLGMEDVQLLVLGPSNRQLGVGELGEIGIRSPHLALGYLNDEELSKKKFIKNPYSNDEYDRIYLTGDLGRYLPNGEVEYFGRLDHQVKIRGFRVELGEVEAALSRHPKVKAAVVVSRDHNVLGKHLVGFWTTNEASQLSEGELKAYLREYLPEYAVPTRLVVMDEFPLSQTRKIDRRKLQDWPLHGIEELDAKDMPLTETETALTEIWCDILGLNVIGRHDDFFDLGGHSLLSMKMLARMSNKFSINIPLRLVFQHKTIAELAQVIDVAAVMSDMPANSNVGSNANRDALFL